MNDRDLAVSRYLSLLADHLREIPARYRNSFIQEIEGHLRSFVQDLDAGLSAAEISSMIEQEFSSPQQLAAELAESYRDGAGGQPPRRSYLFIPLAAAVLASIFMPSYGAAPIAVLCFALAAIVWLRKDVWFFAAARKSMPRLRHRERAARAGSLYLLLIGAILLAGELAEYPGEATINLAAIAVSSLLFFSYVRIRCMD